MFPSISKMPSIESFAEKLLSSLESAGAISTDHSRWTAMYGPHGEFARFSFAQSEHGAPITLDLAPGLESGFGRAVEMLHSSGWRSIFGPELIGREGQVGGEANIAPEIVSPHMAMASYLNTAFTNTELQGLFRKEPQRRFQYALYKGMELGGGAGGLYMYGQVHSERARADFTQRLRVGWEGFPDSEAIYESVQKSALHHAQSDPTNPLAELLGYGLYKDDRGAQSYRPYSLGVEAQTGGSYAFDVMGVSREGQTAAQAAGEMIKRYPISWGFSGVREQGFPMEATGEYTMGRVEPEFISQNPQSAGYKWLNAILPGEQERRAAYVRPNFAFTSASPVSGQAILYGGSGLPPGQIAYGKHEDVRLPDLPMQNLLNMDVSLGIMRQTNLKNEAGDPIYQQTRPFEGATIPPKSSAVIGVVSYDLEGKRRSEPITMTTGPTPRTLEDADLIFPRQFNIASGEGLRHLEAPGTRGVASGENLAIQMQERTGIPTWASSQSGNPLLQIGYAQGAAGTIKAFGSKQMLSELETPYGMSSIGPEVAGRVTSGVSGELKETLSGFVGHTTQLTPRQQISMLGEYANVPGAGPEYGTMATEMQEYASGLHAEFLSGVVKNERPLDWNVISEIYGRHTGVGASRATDALMYSDLRSAVVRPGNEQRSLDEYGYGRFEPEWWRWSMMSKESYNEVMRNAVQGADKWLRDQPEGVLAPEHRKLTTPEGRAYFKGQFPGETVAESLRTHVTRFTPMDVVDTPFGQEGPMGYAEFRGGGIMSALVGGITPEYSSDMPRFGQLERASIAMRYPDLAKAAGIDLRAGTRTGAALGTTLFPEHAKGWEELGDVIRRSKMDELRTKPEGVFEITPVYAEEMQLALTGMAGKDTDYRALQDLHEKLSEGHKGLLYNPDTGLLFPRPIAQQRIEASEYPESSAFYSPISTLSNFYKDAYSQFLDEPGAGHMEKADPATRALRRYYDEGMTIFEQGKGVDKLLKSSIMPGSVGGRYGGRFTAGAGHSIIQAQSLNNMLTGLADASDLPTRDKNRFLAGARETVKAMQRIPGFLQRDPSLSTEGAVQPTWILPVDTLREMGINIPRGTEFRGGKVNAGSVWESNLPFSSGHDLLAMTGDWDADQGQLAMIARVNPSLGLEIINSSDVAESLGFTQRHLVRLQEELIERQHGKEGIVPGGAMNIFADAWSSVIGGTEGGPAEPVVRRIPATTLHEQSWGSVHATAGMGVAYNVRRLLGASSASLMGSPSGASGVHTSGALFYQEYLDKMAGQVLKRGGLRQTETMLNTATWGADFDDDQLTLLARPSAEAGRFISLWEEGGGTGGLTRQMVQALEEDVGGLSQPIGMEYPARLLAMREQHVPELQKMMENQGISGGMSTYKDFLRDEGTRLGVGEMEYDPTRSILGNAMFMSATFRAKGALGKQPRMVETSTGGATLSMNMIGDKIVTYQSEDIRLRSLAWDARMLVGETAYSFETHQGIITPRMIHTTAGVVSEMEQRGMPVPYVLQGIMGVFGGEKVAAEYAQAAAKMGYSDKDRAYAGAIQVAGQMIDAGYENRYGGGTIRGSALNYIGADFKGVDPDFAWRGTQAHGYMQQYLESPAGKAEVPGLIGSEVDFPARHGIGGTGDVVREMPPGTAFGEQRVGLDLKTGKSTPESYAGQASAYVFAGELAAMGILPVSRERVGEIRKDVFTLARQERAASDPGARQSLGYYQEEVGRRIFQEGMQDVTWLSGEDVGADVLQSHLEQLAGVEDITLTAPVLADPSQVSRGGTPTQVPNTVTTVSVNNMLSQGIVGRRRPRKVAPPPASPPSGGAPPGNEPPTTTAAAQPERPEEPEGIGRGIGAEVGQALLEALTESGILVNVAHHSYTKSTRAAYRAGFQAIRNTREYMGQIPGQEPGVNLTTLYGGQWAPELAEMIGEEWRGDVSGLGAATMMARASKYAPDEFRGWATEQADLAQQIQKAVGRPVEVSKGNIGLKGVREMLGATGMDPNIVEQLQNMTSEQNRVDASVTFAGLLTDYLKTEGITDTGGGGGSKLDRLVSTISEESLVKFADSISSTTVEMEGLAKVIKEEGADSVAGIQAAARMKILGGEAKVAKASMLIPGAVQTFQDAMAEAIMDPTDAAKAAAVQAAGDVQGLFGELGAGQIAAAGPTSSTSRFIRGVVGGWGLMYLSRLAKFPLTQAMYGYAEAEQYQTQMAQYAGGQLGEGISPFPSTAMATLQSQLEYGGQGMASYQAMQARLSPMARDLQGMGLAGLAGGAATLYVGSVATQAGLKELGAKLAMRAPGVALAAATAYAGLQAYSWRTQPEQTMVSYVTGINKQMEGEVLEPPGRLGELGFEAGRWPNLAGMGAAFRYMAMTPDDRAEAKAMAQQMHTWRDMGGQPQVMEFMRQYAPEKLPIAAQTFAAEAPEGYDPNLAGATFLRQAGVGTEQQILDSVWAQMSGIDAPGLARQLLKAGRKSWTRPDAVTLENQIVKEQKDIYEAATLAGGISIMEQLPVATLERLYGAGYGSDVRLLEATALELAPWSKSDYGDMLLQEGALESAAGLRGLGRAGPPKEMLDRIRDNEMSRSELRDFANRQLKEGAAQTISAGLGYYLPKAEQAIFDTVMQSDQAEGLYAGALELMPQAEALGIGKYQFLAQMAGREVQGAALGRQALGITSQYAAWGGQQTAEVFRYASQDLTSSVRMQRLMSMDPLAFADEAMQGTPGMAQFAQTVDVGLGGELTGLSWGTTSLARVGQSAQSVAQEIFGDVGAGTDARKAAVEGFETPFGKTWAGTRGLSWYMRSEQLKAQEAAAGSAMAQIALQEEYLPQFWNIQDQQRELQHEQRLWGFDMQRQQFTMQGQQFQENRGLQRRGQIMQRGWAQEDWAYQDQTRALQWGWKTQDFEENVRFMSGRQRKLAETQMERDTIMHGVEGERIDTQRERQKEMWQLEDQRFEMSKKHFNEQRTLQEENMKKQREFYDEGKKLQDEMIKLQREYQLRQLELQKAAAGAQAEAAKKMGEANDLMIAIGEEAADASGEFALAKSRQVDMINTIVKGMNHLINNIPGVFEAMGKALIPLFKTGGGGGVGGSGPHTPLATGGPTLPGNVSIVGEDGIEAIRSSVPQHVFPTNETFAAMIGGADNISDPWSQTFIPTGGTSTSGNGPTTLIINLGNERLAEYILNTVNDALEVR